MYTYWVYKEDRGNEMKKIILFATCLILLNSCSYSVKVGKKCTPGSTEWSYLWFVKGESDLSKDNCS